VRRAVNHSGDPPIDPGICTTCYRPATTAEVLVHPNAWIGKCDEQQDLQPRVGEERTREARIRSHRHLVRTYLKVDRHISVVTRGSNSIFDSSAEHLEIPTMDDLSNLHVSRIEFSAQSVFEVEVCHFVYEFLEPRTVLTVIVCPLAQGPG
jgi:hypothetical protein